MFHQAIVDRYQRIPSTGTVATGDIEIDKDLDSTLLYWYSPTSESDPRETYRYFRRAIGIHVAPRRQRGS